MRFGQWMFGADAVRVRGAWRGSCSVGWLVPLGWSRHFFVRFGSVPKRLGRLVRRFWMVRRVPVCSGSPDAYRAPGFFVQANGNGAPCGRAASVLPRSHFEHCEFVFGCGMDFHCRSASTFVPFHRACLACSTRITNFRFRVLQICDRIRSAYFAPHPTVILRRFVIEPCFVWHGYPCVRVACRNRRSGAGCFVGTVGEPNTVVVRPVSCVGID